MVFLFTLSYPYTVGKEDSFLAPEVSKLKEEFKLIIFPSLIGNEKYTIDQSITFNSQFGEYLAKNNLRFKYFFHLSFYLLIIIEVLQKPLVLTHFQRFKKLISYVINTVRAEGWIKKELLPKINIQKEKKIVLYTYWFTYVTTALCHVFESYSNVKIVTRAHGIDLFEYRNNNYLPLRKYTINALYRFYFVSENGKKYATQQYPAFNQKYKTFPLGVPAHGTLNNLTKDREYHFVSCSNVDLNKRVSLIFDALELYATENSSIKFLWTHFGNGPLFDELKGIVEACLCNNLLISLKGFQPTDTIFNFYKNESVNAFITVTSSEGGRPVSIQEALSFGIPVIATQVGGISELINEKNGLLLPENPDSEELKYAIDRVVKDSDTWNMKRSYCFKTWEAKCDADKLTNNFIKELKSL